jgi:hypothetical protein
MGKKEDKKRLQKSLEKFIITKAHLHDRACEFDKYVDENNLPFYGIDIVGSDYISYISNDGNNFRIKITEKSISVQIY